MFFCQLKSFSSTNSVQWLTWIKSKITQILRKCTNPPEQLVALLVCVGLQLCHWLVLLDEFEELWGVHLRITTVKLLQRQGETRGYNARPPVMYVYGCILGLVLVVRRIITVSHWVHQSRFSQNQPERMRTYLILSGWFCVFPQPTPLASIRCSPHKFLRWHGSCRMECLSELWPVSGAWKPDQYFLLDCFLPAAGLVSASLFKMEHCQET